MNRCKTAFRESLPIALLVFGVALSCSTACVVAAAGAGAVVAAHAISESPGPKSTEKEARAARLDREADARGGPAIDPSPRLIA